MIIKEAVHYLIDSGCNNVILGCTELPLALPYIDMTDVSLIDPNTIIAQSAVRLAGKLEQEKLKHAM
ncbi:aspartate/glutamate racemase family protein [Candidatus Bandiella euplotis]|uniref:aspartate/glutamate racemase family protein n=1 Tax=Candidatus Bandiella euplotis TaxID=1664265 RepID=UPI002B256CC7|nr:aspartate/glutamate racemase family protein [Candidatus Bandiella woodruffii]